MKIASMLIRVTNIKKSEVHFTCGNRRIIVHKGITYIVNKDNILFTIKTKTRGIYSEFDILTEYGDYLSIQARSITFHIRIKNGRQIYYKYLGGKQLRWFSGSEDFGDRISIVSTKENCANSHFLKKDVTQISYRRANGEDWSCFNRSRNNKNKNTVTLWRNNEKIIFDKRTNEEVAAKEVLLEKIAA